MRKTEIFIDNNFVNFYTNKIDELIKIALNKPTSRKFLNTLIENESINKK